MKITFLGAVGTVTGSRYLIENDNTKILVDCGFFQEDGHDVNKNYEPFPVDPKIIDAVVLTHAHIDHTGYIPALVKNGFTGKIYCSHATYALCKILLRDSGAIQEEDAKKIRENDGDNASVQPIYTEQEAEYSLRFFKTVAYDMPIDLGGSLTATLICSEHILGSSFVVLSDGEKTVTFSGDLGRPHSLIMKPVPYIKQTDYVVLESTYGNRLHTTDDPLEVMGALIRKTVERGGKFIIPAFAVGRTQTILYCLHLLKKDHAIPDVPIFLDSPMAIDVTDLYCRFHDEHKLSANQCRDAFHVATYVRTVEQSKKIDHHSGSAIIIAGSGMATGGRVLDHFRHFISDERTTVLFVGFQAQGTLGRELVDGAKEIIIRDKAYPVRAEIEDMAMLSAHADYKEIVDWLEHMDRSPKTIFLTHGEPEAAQFLQKQIEDRLGWKVIIPRLHESFDLG